MNLAYRPPPSRGRRARGTRENSDRMIRRLTGTNLLLTLILATVAGLIMAQAIHNAGTHPVHRTNLHTARHAH
jgi:hypothetical protein